MDGELACPQCGESVPVGSRVCPACHAPIGPGWFERESLLLASLVILVMFFVVTAFAAKLYRAKQRSLAQDWFGRGQAALKAHEPKSAVEDFRTALVYAGENSGYELQLALALADAGQEVAAQSYLESLWEREPGNGVINQQLARLYAREGNIDQAVRYFHNAIYGVWEGNQDAQRLATRLELCRLLLQWNRKEQAEPELIELAERLPRDSALHNTAGTMFLKVQDYPRALSQFRSGLRLTRKNEEALEGAGEASFQTENYAAAVSFFEAAVRSGAIEPAKAKELEVSRLVIDYDPLERSLSEQERARRAIQAFNFAVARLLDCATQRNVKLGDSSAKQGDWQAAYATAMSIEPQVHQEFLRHHPEVTSSVLDAVGQMESAARNQCGPGSARDEALLRIARREGGNRP